MLLVLFEITVFFVFFGGSSFHQGVLTYEGALDRDVTPIHRFSP